MPAAAPILGPGPPGEVPVSAPGSQPSAASRRGRFVRARLASRDPAARSEDSLFSRLERGGVNLAGRSFRANGPTMDTGTRWTETPPFSFSEGVLIPPPLR